MFRKKEYSLSKSRHIYRHAYSCYRRSWRHIEEPCRQQIEDILERLDTALYEKKRKEASDIAKTVEELGKTHLRKPLWVQARDLIIALTLALLVATFVRQVWFEHYEVPTGSMRPTLKEMDHLLVSKTDFGVNIPLHPGQLYFDPHLMQRLGIVVFTIENMDFEDSDAKYFYIFPSKKRLIKRLIALPGDTLYFYGGKLYGIDAEGKDLPELRESPYLEGLDHIPFIQSEGKVRVENPNEQGIFRRSVLCHMNQPVAAFTLQETGRVQGELLVPGFERLDEVWGLGNYAMARMMTREQAMSFSMAYKEGLEEAPMYLELRHTPSLVGGTLGIDRAGVRPVQGSYVTLLPLHEEHLQRCMENMYTSRFFVRGEKALEYSLNQPAFSKFSPSLPHVPDGRYEFYHGVAYNVGWGGLVHPLLPGHPLYTPQHRQVLFNMGVHWNELYMPSQQPFAFFPERYVYFRDGDLYVLGAPLMRRGEPTLARFILRERQMETLLRRGQYRAFVDRGAPVDEEGIADAEFIRRYGLTVPEGHYLVLGDNHALSGDSRMFGFVPAENMRGAPTWLIWPPGERWGLLPQPRHPWGTLPQLIVWGSLATLSIGGTLLYRRRLRKVRFRRMGS